MPLLSITTGWTKKDFTSLRKPKIKELKKRLLENNFEETNFDNIPKINLTDIDGKNKDLHPKRIFKKKEMIRYITPTEKWEEFTPESRRESVPERILDSDLSLRKISEKRKSCRSINKIHYR